MKRTATEAAETRTAILAAGMRVFAERGYTAATLAEIGARAQVTRGAVYHHFGDKAALYVAAISERWATVGARVWAPLAEDGPVRPRLRRCLITYLRAMEDDWDFRELLDVTILRSETVAELEQGVLNKQHGIRSWVHQLAEVFQIAQQAGQLRPDVTPNDAAVIVVSVLAGAVVTWRMGGEDVFSPAQRAEVHTDAILSALFV